MLYEVITGVNMDINQVLNELLVSLFKDINEIEEKAIQTEDFLGITTNDVHVMEAIGTGTVKNMSTVARALGVTMGTLTISVNSLVKKGYVITSYSIHYTKLYEKLKAIHMFYSV